MYKPRYTFWNEKRFPQFIETLDNIYTKSVDNYIESHKTILGSDIDFFKTFVNDLEYFYASIISNGIVTEKNYKNVLEQLKLIDIVVIPFNNKLHGATLGYQISINPNIDEDYGLGKNGFIQLCVSHELGHIINNKWYDDAKELSKKIYNNPSNEELFNNLDINDYRYILFGFDLINEVVSEDTAERVVQRLVKNFKKVNKNKLIVYDELYKYALEFAKSLDYVSTNKNISDDEVMLRLIRRSFDEYFIKNISKEIDNSDIDKRNKLITMLVCMGKIKAYSYEVVGLNKNSEKDVDNYKDIFNNISRRK